MTRGFVTEHDKICRKRIVYLQFLNEDLPDLSTAKTWQMLVKKIIGITGSICCVSIRTMGTTWWNGKTYPEKKSWSHNDCTISKYCHTINKNTQKRKKIQKLKTCNGQPIVQYSNKKHSRMCLGQNHLSSYQPREQIIGNLLIISCEWPCDWLTISESWVYRIKNIHKCNLSFHLLVNWP